MFELHIKPCHEQTAELISNTLESFGALSVTMVDEADTPILEPGPGETPLWQHSVIQALFESDGDANTAWDTISKDYPKLTHNILIVPEEDWVRNSVADIEPKQFGENLWICPSWCEPPNPDSINILLDPGLAFGTGTHPTTSLCLKWLDNAEVQDKTVIDYGCGSGILALAALKLEAKHAHAVDIDEQALIATRDNAIKNSIDEARLTCEIPEALDTPVDILLANILLTPLLSLKERFMNLLEPGGQLVLSGILKTQVDELIEAYSNLDLTHQSTQYEDEWAVLIFTKS